MNLILKILRLLFTFNFLQQIQFIKKNNFTNKVSNGVGGMSIGNISVTTNQIFYPSDIVCCCCGAEIKPTQKTIDSSTWDLICSCGEIGYHHPMREERQNQIRAMLSL